MGRKFYITPTLDNCAAITVRFGTQNTAYKETEIGKLLKNNGDSGATLAAVGDPFHGVLVALDAATADGYAIGSMQRKGKFFVMADGSEAAGTGNLAVGDQLVTGTPVAKDTALAGITGFPKVRKATAQIVGGAPADLAAAGVSLGRIARNEIWTVVSLNGTDGSPGKIVVMEHTSALSD